MLCGPVPGTRRLKQAGRFHQSQNNLKMCRVTEQKQNNNCLMTQFDCGLVLIAHSEYVFIISTVLHEYGCPHSAALIVCNNFPRMLISFFLICVFCFRATKLCWADGLPVVRELTEVIKHFSYSTQQVTYRSLAQLSTKFILLINGKILTFISMINATSNRYKARNFSFVGI